MIPDTMTGETPVLLFKVGATFMTPAGFPDTVAGAGMNQTPTNGDIYDARYIAMDIRDA